MGLFIYLFIFYFKKNAIHGVGLQQQCALNGAGDDAGSGASEHAPGTASEAAPAARTQPARSPHAART